MRDWAYEHESMPTETDEQFVAMVKKAASEGRFRSDWDKRLIEIAERALKDKRK